MKRSLYVFVLLAIGSTASAFGQSTRPTTSVVAPIQSVNQTLFGNKQVDATEIALEKGNAPTTPATTQTDAVADVPDKKWAINFTADYASSFYFRGYMNDNHGAMFQPSLDLSYTVYNANGWTIAPHIGTWASITTWEGPSSPKNVYEVDGIAGIDIKKDVWDLGLLYTYYNSPGGFFKDQHEVSANLSYDDTDLMKNIGIPIALQPHVQLAQLVKNYGGANGTYLEFGIAPVFAIPNTDWTFTLPVTIGTSPHNYYTTDKGHNDFLGYVNIVPTLTIPLPIDKKYGQWSVHTSFEYDRLFSDSLYHANGNSSNGYTARLGLSVLF